VAQGKKTDNETIYKIMMSYYITRNYSETGRELGMNEATIRHIVKENIGKEEFTKLFEKKKEEFIETANRIINKGTELLEKRIDLALDNQDELDELIFEVWNADKDEIDPQAKKGLVSKLNKLQLNNLNEITTAIGIMYDKKKVAESGTIPVETPTLNINIIDNSNLEKELYKGDEK